MTFLLLLVLLAAVSPATPQTTSFLIDSIGGPSNDPSTAAAFSFEDIRGVATDAAGNLYVSDSARHRVIQISPTGAVRTIAGTGVSGYSGDNGPASAAQLNLPYGLATDAQGALYISDLGNARLRRVGTDGVIRTVAGGGSSTPAAGLAATAIQLKSPRNVAVDAAGGVYLSDFQDHRVLKVGGDGRITLVAGTGTAGAAVDGVAVTAPLNSPAGLFVDTAGALYIADSANHVVRKVVGTAITTVAVQFAAQNISLPVGVAADTAGNLYIASAGFDTLVRVAPGGAPTVIGTGGARDVNVSRAGVIHYATATEVRRLSAAGQWVAVSSSGSATQLVVATPDDVKVDGSGALLVADGTANRVYRMLPATGASTVLAGTGDAGFSGDNGQATAARLNAPKGVAADSGGNVYIADTANHRIRRVDTTGLIRTVAGTGSAGNTYEARAALQAAINSPTGIAVSAAGEVYFADTGNHMIRRLTTTGLLYPVAGNGVAGFRGDGSGALLAQLSSPRGVAFDAQGNLLIADSGNHRIRRITPQGVISTVAGTGAAGFAGDGGPALQANLNQPTGVAAGEGGSVYIADSGNQRVRQTTAAGVINTVAGTGVKGFSGDQGQALAAKLDTPVAVAAASSGGAVFIADRGNQRVRQLTLGPGTGVTTDTGELRVLHAATLEASPVAPGMLVVLQGVSIGPVVPAASRIVAGVPLETSLGGVQVRFDGTPAPLLYAQDNMIHLQAPYRIAGTASTKIEVLRDGVVQAQTTVVVAPVAPGIFATGGGSGTVAAIHEDSTMNSESSPVARGATLLFYITGEGAVTPELVEGKLADPPFPAPAQPLTVRVGQAQAEVVSASAALTAPGLMQVVVRVPTAAATGRQTLQVTVGSTASQANVVVFVR